MTFLICWAWTGVSIGQEPIGADDVLEAWSGRAADEYPAVDAERVETYTDNDEKRVTRFTYKTRMLGEMIVVHNEMQSSDGQYTAEVSGMNDKYAFKLMRAEPDGAWQLKAIDIGQQRLSNEVQKDFNSIYYWADQAEHFVAVDGLIALALNFPDRFQLTATEDEPRTFSFSFNGEDNPRGRMDIPIPSIMGVVEVAHSSPYTPTRIQWSRESNPSVTSTIQYETDASGSVEVTERTTVSSARGLECVSTLSRLERAPSDDAFYLSHYGIDEPELSSSPSVNWPLVMLVLGGVALVGVICFRRFRSN